MSSEAHRELVRKATEMEVIEWRRSSCNCETCEILRSVADRQEQHSYIKKN